MRRKVAIFSFVIMTAVMGLPFEASASSAVKETSLTTSSSTQVYVMQERRRRGRHGSYWQNGRWYRNYGQYRRTQVGWRRYRMAPRYYWRDGRRYTTYRRVYYFR